jgi:hypothetical protein
VILVQAVDKIVDGVVNFPGFLAWCRSHVLLNRTGR